MAIVIGWIALSIVAGVIAANKGRSRLGFIVLSLFLSPLVGIIAALVARPDHGALEKEQLESGTSVKCPACAELIRSDALKCRHCGTDVSKVPRNSPSSPPERDTRNAYKFGKRVGKIFSRK
jgi:hypothetical protein